MTSFTAPQTRSSPLRVFLSGASSGIGEALARHYAAQGAVLGLVARREAHLRQLAAELPGQHFCYPLDVTDSAALQAAADDFMRQAGVPHIVIANAGISVGTLTEEADDLQAVRRVMDVNVLGAIQTLQPFVAPMRAAGRGRLVGVSSVAGTRGLPGAGAYSASKAALRTYLESLRVELRGSGVKVVTLTPGYIETPMTAVSTYPMPFLMPVTEAAPRLARAIEAGRALATVPWPMGVAAQIMKWLPCWLYDRLAAKAGRKPRQLKL